jgi:hypothetical protein
MNGVLFIFVGEFSYAMNWIAPLIHERFQQLNNVKKIVVSYAAHEMIYRHFCDEFIALPVEITDKLCYTCPMGDGKSGHITPDFVIEYSRKLYPNADIMTLPRLDGYANQASPPGIYEHLSPSDKVKQEIDIFLEGFDKDCTVTIMPKIRTRPDVDEVLDLKNDSVHRQNWDLNSWVNMVKNLIKDGYNVVSMFMKNEYLRGGSLSLPIEHPNFREFNVDLTSNYALDQQVWLLKSTLCSIYGSTGAHNIPFWVGTPVCALIHSNYYQRSFFEWQKKLTNNHINNKIISIEDFFECNYNDIYGDIIDYINRRREL